MGATVSYELNLTVIEARHLYGTERNANIFVEVTIDKKCKRVLAITKNSTHPKFKGYPIEFKFKESLETVLKKLLIISVYSSRYGHLGKKLIGITKIELGTVWCQPDHKFYHKWAPLTKSTDPFAGVSGYLKCDLRMGLKDTIFQGEDGDDVEENLMTASKRFDDESFLARQSVSRRRHKLRPYFYDNMNIPS